MHRFVSVLIVAVFLSQSVGFVHVTLPNLEVGQTKLKEQQPRKTYFDTQIIQALFNSKNIEEYESMVFVGDVLLARNVEYIMRSKSPDYPFSGLDLTTLGSRPAVIGNFEAAVPVEHVPTPIGMIDFSVPSSAIPHLKAGGFTHMSLGNNHSFDFEEAGFVNTTKVLDEYVSVFGHPNAIKSHTVEIVDVSGTKAALIGINGLLPLKTNALQDLLKKLSKNTEYQIVYIHWGEEYALRQNVNQKELAKVLVDYGADLIVGHHPHVVQGVDLIEGVPVFYSLGNYIFDQYFSKDVQEGLVLAVNFESGMNISLVPVTSQTSLSQPNLMSEKKHAAFLEVLSRKSHPEIKSAVSAGLIKISEEIATFDKVAIIQDTEVYVQ